MRNVKTIYLLTIEHRRKVAILPKITSFLCFSILYVPVQSSIILSRLKEFEHQGTLKYNVTITSTK